MKENKLEGLVKAMYLSGIDQKEILERTGVNQWYLLKLIDKLVEHYKVEDKEFRINQATLMERNIFDLIEKKQDVSGLINYFSSFCA